MADKFERFPDRSPKDIIESTSIGQRLAFYVDDESGVVPVVLTKFDDNAHGLDGLPITSGFYGHVQDSIRGDGDYQYAIAGSMTPGASALNNMCRLDFGFNGASAGDFTFGDESIAASRTMPFPPELSDPGRVKNYSEYLDNGNLNEGAPLVMIRRKTESQPWEVLVLGDLVSVRVLEPGEMLQPPD